jgi:hypothetical protein
MEICCVADSVFFNSNAHPQMAVLGLVLSATLAQQYSGGSNYVESDYEYEAPAQEAPAPRPPPRSFSRPAPSPIRQSGPPAPRATPVPILKQINR